MVQFKFNLEAWSNSCSFLILNLHACGPRQLKLLSRGTHGNSSTVGLMIAYLIYPPGNDRWKYYLKWYITAPWASFIAFFHRYRWGTHTSEPINLWKWKLGIQYGMNTIEFFSSMSTVVWQAEPVPHWLRCQSDRMAHPLVSSTSWFWCLQVCHGLRLGASTPSMYDYRHIIAQVRRS